ncbi:MAG: hypothetical protein Q4E91_10270 [Lachnospiraceae bacterium]|nr:hypothetical protein [Lachnospiraceae bacterium]
MKGLCDCHCHILPGVDDGAQSMEEALAMLRVARDEGIGAMVLTPHMHGKEGVMKKDVIRTCYQKLCGRAASEGGLPKLYLASEVYASLDMADWLKAGAVFTLEGSRYVLAEFHPGSYFHEMGNIVKNLRASGYYLVLAHIERYQCLLENPRYVNELLELGVLFQCNAAAVLGKEGMQKKRFIRKLLQEQKIAMIGTDAHNTEKRPPHMKACYLYLCKKYGQEYADWLCGGSIEQILHRK